MRTVRTLLASVLLLSLAACGKDEEKAPPSTPGGTPAATPAAIPTPSDPALAELAKFIEDRRIDRTREGWKTRLPKPPKVTFDPSKKYYWELVTNKGTMRFEFFPHVAPMHVSSFAYLTLLGYFDGLKFHRVIKGFMAQGGDPLGNGTGGPGYSMEVEVSPTVRHDHPGILSTANSGRPSTDGSQFFITFKATPNLDGGYTVFGSIVKGEDTLRAIEAAGNPNDGPPLEPLHIVKATVSAE